MKKTDIKTVQRITRHRRIRSRVSGTSDKPRLAVYKSNKYMYAQLIDDEANATIASASSLKMKGNTIETAKKIGAELAKKALDMKVKKVVFDRGGFNYTGKIKALADAAREAGLEF